MNIFLAKIQSIKELLDSRPNMVDMEPHFLRAIFVQHLHIVVPILREMQAEKIDDLPMRQFVNPKA